MSYSPQQKPYNFHHYLPRIPSGACCSQGSLPLGVIPLLWYTSLIKEVCGGQWLAWGSSQGQSTHRQLNFGTCSIMHNRLMQLSPNQGDSPFHMEERQLMVMLTVNLTTSKITWEPSFWASLIVLIELIGAGKPS